MLIVSHLISGGPLQAFQAGAYIPHYRLSTARGASNFLGRPCYETSPRSWDGKIVADRPESTRDGLPDTWQESSWSLRLTRGYESFYLHIPMDDDFLAGKSPDIRHINFLKTLISVPEKAVYLSLLGSSSDFLPRMSSPEKLEILVSRISGIAAENGLNGINLDWEFVRAPGEAEARGLTELAEALRASLPPEMKLSVAVSRWRLPETALFDIVDEIHLMAYDGTGRHATFEAAQADAEILLNRLNLPASKLVLGLPFYGRVFDSTSEGYWADARNYRDILMEFGSGGKIQDEAGPYYFNGPLTIADKTRWALDRGLAGVFIWEPFYDADGEESLSRAIRGEVRRR